MSDARLILGDCLEVLRQIETGSVDAVVTDPPYGIAYQSAWRIDKRSWKPKIANDQRPFVWFLHDAARAIKDGGCLLCFCRWDTAEAFRLAIEWAGLRIGSQLIWDRVGHGMGDLKGRPSPRHDIIWFAVKGRYQFPGKRPASVYRIPRLAGVHLEHPNQKPVPLMAEMIADYVPPGGVVLDPCMGSGATGEACAQTGHRFVGVELDREKFELAERRIAAARGQAA